MEIRNSNAHYNKTTTMQTKGVLHITTNPNITGLKLHTGQIKNVCTNNREISPPGKKQVRIKEQDFFRSYSICSTADAKVVDWTGLS